MRCISGQRSQQTADHFTIRLTNVLATIQPKYCHTKPMVVISTHSAMGSHLQIVNLSAWATLRRGSGICGKLLCTQPAATQQTVTSGTTPNCLQATCHQHSFWRHLRMMTLQMNKFWLRCVPSIVGQSCSELAIQVGWGSYHTAPAHHIKLISQ